MTEHAYYLSATPTLAEALDDIQYFVQGFLWHPTQQNIRLMMLDELLLVAKFALDRERSAAAVWSDLDWKINAPKEATSFSGRTLTLDDLDLDL